MSEMGKRGAGRYSLLGLMANVRKGIFDCGASVHMTGDESLLCRPWQVVDLPVRGVGGSLRAISVSSGVVVVDGYSLTLPELYYVPGLGKTLVSSSELAEDGYDTLICKRGGVGYMSVSRLGKEVFRLRTLGGIYPAVFGVATAATATVDLGKLLHKRFGHVSSANQHWARRIKDAYGVHTACTKAQCESCMRAKMHVTISKLPPTRPATRPLERILLDYSPSVPVKGIGGQTGFLLIVDEYTRKWFPFCIRSKSEVNAILAAFKAMAETHFSKQGYKLSSLRSDGENVLVSKEVEEWCSLNGVRHEVSAAYSQWQNGIVERAIGLAWEGSEAMRKEAGAPKRYWPFSLLAFSFTRNRLAIGENELSPYELWWGVAIPIKRRLGILRVWGCKCYSYVSSQLRKKLDDKARVCVHLGYSNVTKGYWLIELSTGRFFTSAVVQFDECDFPLKYRIGPLDDSNIAISWPAMPRMPKGIGGGRSPALLRDPVDPIGDASSVDVSVSDSVAVDVSDSSSMVVGSSPVLLSGPDLDSCDSPFGL